MTIRKLTNPEIEEAYGAIICHVIDHVLKSSRTDWLATFQDARALAKKETAEAARKAQAARDTTSHPSLPLERYVGTYRDAWIESTSTVGGVVHRDRQAPGQAPIDGAGEQDAGGAVPGDADRRLIGHVNDAGLTIGDG